MRTTRSWILIGFCLAAGSSLFGAEDAPETVAARARAARLAEDPVWLRLGHYERHGGRWVSRQDGPAFFLSPRGKRDPQAELEATVLGLFDDSTEDTEARSPVRCRFPARAAWLRERLGPFGSEAPCPRWEDWRGRLDPGSVTLVFASAYMANPASMYGHTFLRLNRRDRPPGERLNDYCVNFAAETPTRNGIVFAVKGLFGGYDGKFTTLPYYMQVQRYNNVESRDLWEYDLALGTAAVEGLVRHLWELGGARFDYFFLTENCSFALLPLLEAGDPRLDLSARYTVKVIPVDTVRAVTETPGLVRARRLRPSQVRTLVERRRLLTLAERRVAERLGRETETAPFPSLDGLSPERQALVLDSALDLFRYRRGLWRLADSGGRAAERNLLLRRGAIAVDPAQVPAPVFPPEDPPENGHRTGRIGPGGGRSNGKGFVELSLRPALHDFADDPRGYIRNSRLDMFHLIVRQRDGGRRPYLERLALVDIQSLSPWETWVRPSSWKAFLGGETAADRPVDPENSFALRGNYGRGLALPAGPRAVVYALGEGDAGAGNPFDKSFRTGAGISSGFVFRPGSRVRAWGDLGAWRYFWGDVSTVVRQSLGASLDLTKRFALRVQARRDGDRKETLFSALFYL